MTKTVRIENADSNTTYKVRVRAQEKNAEGDWVDAPEAVQSLDFPTAMAQVGIHSHRRFIVEEATAS